MNRFKIIFRYINYLLRSTNEHGIHSPFLFHFVLNVIYLRHPFYSYDELDNVREFLLSSKQKLKIDDFGAGSRVFKNQIRSVNEITAKGISNRKQAELLFRLVNHFQPKTILELGTSLGLTTMYLASGNQKSTVYTFEGSGALADFAQELFNKNNFNNIRLIRGKFDDQLPKFLSAINKVDFAYIDGNHAKEATLYYFNSLLEKSHEQTVMIFDDINWSDEMQSAWNTIKKHERVKISIDLFFMGILLFRKEQKEQEHFTIRW